MALNLSSYDPNFDDGVFHIDNSLINFEAQDAFRPDKIDWLRYQNLGLNNFGRRAKFSFNEDHLKAFMTNFPSFKKQSFSVKRMYEEIKQIKKDFYQLSLSCFYKHFVKDQHFEFCKPKIGIF